MDIHGKLSLYPAAATGLTELNKYVWVTTSYSGNYIHFKTNVTLNTYIMTRVEAIGVNYAVSAPIRSAWCWYSYSYLIDGGSQNIYTGLQASGVYMSSDGYICFRGSHGSSLGDAFFMLSVVHANPTGYGADILITAANQNSVSGNYY